eukprot:TRINITY_DN6186_c0_g1_i1.p1 TRINITY_DN6186_c0_g1~~TRINITY_DN6186_c0_g1_i1.p1  ORF type:complete len:189 (-),score=53.36 TRINITY_DN6186_c0_g1_i1:1199-1765(-)
MGKGEEIYTVEMILDRKKEKGKYRYLLKWLGYDEPTWEHERNLLGCEELIEDYLNRVAEGKVNKEQHKEKKAGSSIKRDRDDSPKQTPEPVKQKRRRSERLSVEDDRSHHEGDAPKVELKFILDDDPEIPLEPARIIAARMFGNELFLHPEFEEPIKARLFFKAKVFNKRWPQLVIKFYESKINFASD